MIYELPHFNNIGKDLKYPDIKIPHMDYPNVEESIQTNTNIIKTNKQIDEDDKTNDMNPVSWIK